MRRVFTAALLSLFVSQSSGAAMAAAAPQAPVARPFLAEAQLAITQTLHAIRGTYIGAMLTGQVHQWQAMHQAAPTPPPHAHAVPPSETRNPHWVLGEYRGRGAAREVPAQQDSPSSLLHAFPDPHAMDARIAASKRHSMILGGGGGGGADPSYLMKVMPAPDQISGATPGSTLDGSASCFSNWSPVQCWNFTVTSDNAAIAYVTVGTIGTPTPFTYHFVGVGTTTLHFRWVYGDEDDQISVVAPNATPSPTPTPTQAPTPTPTPVPTPTPIPVTPTPSPTPTPVPTLAPSTTGINRWWTYEEVAIPGVGKAMVNAANGNLLVQSDDLDIPERGVDLAFRRTYNSKSNHDASNSDGSTQAVFGNGWTNTFDAHVEYRAGLNASCPTAQGVIMYDIDGARYDFAPDCNGNFISPPGLQGTTMAAYSNGCILGWHKKSGTFYTFFSPDYSSAACMGSSYSAYDGHIHKIYGRNTNNVVVFTYYWTNGDSTNPNNLSEIDAAHADGQTLVLKFALYGGHDELQSLVRPDGQAVTYLYDGAGNLTDVCDIGNGSSTTASGPCAAGQIHYQYAYNANSHQLAWVNSPNWVMTNYNCGTYQSYSYDGSNRATTITNTGTSNPYIADGTNGGGAVQTSCSGSGSLLQSGYTPNYGSCTGCQTAYFSETFGYSAGLTSLTDKDGHSTNWHFDGTGRVTETDEWTGAPNNLWLTTYATWDGTNNLTETVDARGNATDYGYDGNGNTIWVQQPWIVTSLGNGRPLARYGYDQYNNLLAYCDPQYVWTSGVTTCAATAGTAHYTWNYSDANEPYGYLTDTYTPMGYHHHIDYSTASQSGGDYGLPTDVTGDPISQTIDSSTPTRTPHTAIAYDPYGNVSCYATFQDATGERWWRASYDSINRRTATADADDASLSVAQCTNSPGISGSHIESTTTYYSNGQVSSTQSPSEYAAGVSTAFSYDADGNETSESHHYGNQTGTTYKWYDGGDRLVEVQQPHDANGHDFYSYAWSTRYDYDLAQGNPVALNSASFRAYGNLYKTQEFAPSAPVVQSGSTPAGPAWIDVRGTSFDALDRPLASYENAFGVTPKLIDTYDGNGNYGLLSQTQNAVGQQSILSYYSTGQISQKQYLNDGGATPQMTYTYDPDGRAATISSSQVGAQTQSFDADGRLVQVAEPSQGGFASPATIAYGYYADGLRKSVSVTSTSLTQANLYQYAYRNDGSIESEQLAGPVVGSYAWTYTPGGRELTQSDPYTGKVITLYNGSDVPSGSTRTLQAKSYSYDGYGRVQSLVLPEGYTYNGFAYDDEGEATTYIRSNAYAATKICTTTCNSTTTHTYSVRGELVVNQDQGIAAFTEVSANGTLIHAGSSTSSDGYDARSGMVSYRQSTNLSYAYDAAGRQTQITNPAPAGYTGTAYAARGYDAENHVISQFYSGTSSFWCVNPQIAMCGNNPNSGNSSQFINAGTNLTYKWGPNGHPVLLTGPYLSTSTDTVSVHWDGDDILFAQNQNNYVVMNVGKLGVADISGSEAALYVTDRDMDGSVVASHTADSFSAWSAAAPGKQLSNKLLGSVKVPNSTASDNDMYVPPTEYLTASRTDGYSDGFGNTFQGVRSYDGTAGQWTAPDAYAGAVHDPMSQKPFMWNNNNPIEYEDPSGYVGVLAMPPDPLTMLSQAKAAYDFLIGDDIRTLRDPKASTGAKVVAGLMLVSNVFGPDEFIGKAAASVGVKSVSYAARVISRAIQDPAFHGFSQYVDKAVFDKGMVTLSRGNYVKFTAQGIYMGKDGEFQIFGHLDASGHLVVDHRAFIPKRVKRQ